MGILTFALAAAIALAQPNPRLTPGAVRPITVHEICTTAWGHDTRAVTEKNKRDVFAAYGIAWADRGRYEVDHRESRDIGGSDPVRGRPATENLWPQPLWQAKHLKDPLEVKLKKLICTGTITIVEAQAALAGDWTTAYVKYVGKPLPAVVPR